MKAFEAKQCSIESQYNLIMEEIKKEIIRTGKRIIKIETIIYDEVIEMLVNDGFDIIKFRGNMDSVLYYLISCENAEEGKKGKVTWSDENFPNLKVTDGLQMLYGII